jgi:hypothetical protein
MRPTFLVLLALTGLLLVPSPAAATPARAWYDCVEVTPGYFTVEVEARLPPGCWPSIWALQDAQVPTQGAFQLVTVVAGGDFGVLKACVVFDASSADVEATLDATQDCGTLTVDALCRRMEINCPDPGALGPDART